MQSKRFLFCSVLYVCLSEWCVKMNSVYNIPLYCIVTIFIGDVDLCPKYLERGQIQIHGIDDRDITKSNAVPYHTKEDSVYIPRVCSGPYCKSRSLSKHNHQPVQIYVTPVPSARLHDHEYTKKKNKITPHQRAINPYFFQNPDLQTYDVILCDSCPLENDKRNKRDYSGEGTLPNNPAVEANIDKNFGSTTNQHYADTFLNNPELQANIENIFNPKLTTDEQYRHNNNKKSNNVDQANIVPASATYSKSNQYPKLQTTIVNLYGPPVLPYLKDNKILETKYQNDDIENAGQEYRLQGANRMIDIYNKSVINESVKIFTHATPRTTVGPQIYVKTQEPTNDPELAQTILAVFGTPSISAATDRSDTTKSSHKVNAADSKSGNANDTELAQTILDVFGTPSISAATDRSDTTESSHKMNTADSKSGNANDIGDEDNVRSLHTIQNSSDRTSQAYSGAHAQKTSFVMFICFVCQHLYRFLFHSKMYDGCCISF